MEKEVRKSRPLRMLDDEWEDFKSLLGPEWLRRQIAEARYRKKQNDSKES